MATVALDPAYRRVSVEEFLEMDFGHAKAELEDGVIFMMAGGDEEHSRIAANILMYLGAKLRGSGCRPYGSDMATRTDRRTIRYPDVSVFCNTPSAPENARKRLLGDPTSVFEVLSPSTRGHDQRVKLPEYCDLPGVREVVLVDPRAEGVRLVRRDDRGEWHDRWLEAGEDIFLPSLAVTLPHHEVFARD